ncbi:hypothetical protein PV10_02916 [Exophiala mesophila]|uniref:Fe2OG dioxygenase domain-containing protein n=1 Tax=Exophiala mesophila TaxID=212818 RepID=A0A0D1X0F0_EXOME|nr:uncharacterized protein PV10_02916 [Exophiala mesophila]KIV95240.1 hypothetical protein PV10_02916 [Exophiala mesophila]
MAGKVNMDDLQHLPAQVGVSDAAFEIKSNTVASKSCPEFTPEAYPPLPSNLETVQLPIISIDDLATPFPDKDSTLRLFEACKSPGIFYLKPPAKMSHERDNLVARATEWITKLEPAFHLPVEKKRKYNFIDSTRIFGYKEVGATVVDDVGTGDTSEFWNISKNELLKKQSLPSVHSTMAGRYPDIIEDNSSSLVDFMQDCHLLCMTILSAIEQELGVRHELQMKHEFSDTSGDHVRLARGPARVGQEIEIQTPAHTDFGTVTLLFNWLGGLQWRDPADLKWKWVAPKPDHLLVNLGDAACIFTGGLCKAPVHRVVPAPGAQGSYPRYSLGYFLRPGDKVILNRLCAPTIPQGLPMPGTGVTAERWIAIKAEGLGIGRQVLEDTNSRGQG